MTPEEKQSALQRHRDIVLATIDYLISIHAGSVVVDNKDHIADYYEQQKLQTEKYFQQRKQDRIQQRFASLTKGLENSIDLNFASYIKEKTGYDIDILEDLRKRVDVIISQKKIRTKREEIDIGTMLRYLIDTSSKTETIDKLKSLLLQYSKANRNRKNEYSEIPSSAENNGNGEVTLGLSIGTKPKHFKEQQIVSPDKKRRLFLVERSDGKQSTTTLTIQFENGASTAVFGVRGIYPGVEASWKNNTTIVIKTKSDCEVMLQHEEVRSFNDCIVINYIDIDEN